MKVHHTNPNYRDVQYVANQKEGVDKVLGAGSRRWQVDVLDLFRESRFSALTCPCGAGKSTAQVGLAIQDVIASKYERLQLFVMPQTHISDGFFKANGVTTTIEIKGTVYTVAVSAQHNFCSDSSIAALKKLLLTDRKKLAKLCSGKSLSGLFAMTSNQALTLAWKQMTAAERARAIHNLHLRLDESHHVRMGESNPADIEDSNNLGKIANFVLESADKTARMTFSTATNFRGDLRSICSPKHAKKFVTFSLDWVEHFQTLGIKDLYVMFEEFKRNPIQQLVANVCSEKNQNHCIVVPPSNAGWRQQYGKDEGVKLLSVELRKKWKGARILELVTEETQAANKALLIAEPKTAADGAAKFDVVITCMLGREGTDWCPCSRLHVTYVEGSITLAVQTLGRLLRRFAGKAKAIARYYYPEFPKPQDGLSKAELLDDRKNALLLASQIDEMFLPIMLPELPAKAKGTEHTRTNHMGTLESCIGSQAYIALKKDFLSNASDVGIAAMDTNGAGFADLLKEVIEATIEDSDIDEELHDAAVETLKAIWLRWASPKFKGINIAFIREAGFSKLVAKTTAFGRTLIGHHDAKKMKQMRDIVDTVADQKVAEIARVIKTQNDWDKHKHLCAWARIFESRQAAA